MKLEIIKDRLKEAVGSVERVTSRNASLAILNNVVLEAQGAVLSVKATNLETGIEIQVPAKIDKEGVVAVNGQVLVSFLNNLYQEDKVIIEVIEGNLHILTNKGATLVKCFPADDFPSIPHVDDGFNFALSSRDLIDCFKSVIYAASTSDIKPEISSVYVYYESPGIFFVATDSFRLAEKKLISNGKIDGDFNPLIIPFKNTLEVVRIFDGLDEMVNIQANKHQLSIYTKTIHFTSRLIDSVFPDYRQIMPKDHTTEAFLNKTDLLNALKLANVFSDRLNQVDIKILPKDGLLEINSRNQDVGENTVKLKSEITGEEVSMSFNVKYLIDCLPAINSDKLIMRFNGNQRPMIMTGFGADNFTYLVMPVRR